ncbi:MAG: hypothetical protein ACYSUC_02915 [Planctomycetota bacterium]
MRRRHVAVVLIVMTVAGSSAVEIPQGEEFHNSIGMKFVRIGAGDFEMGIEKIPLPEQWAKSEHLRDGDPDERSPTSSTRDSIRATGICAERWAFPSRATRRSSLLAGTRPRPFVTG